MLSISTTPRIRRRPTLMSEINVTPLVDVMLVLLVIFMVTAPMLVSGVNVDLPSSNSAPATSQDEPLTVTVDNKGQIYIMDMNVQSEALQEKLQAITNNKLDTRIFVRGDRRVDYGTMVSVMARIYNAGFKQVALVTKIDTSP